MPDCLSRTGRLRNPTSPPCRRWTRLLFAALAALTVNFALLALWDRLGIVTAHGGFQRLVKLWLAKPAGWSGIGRIWAASSLPAPDTPVFMAGFKVLVGLGMALAYGLTVPFVRAVWWAKALGWALLVWLVNAGVVLPLLGEGFAGAEGLAPAGIAAFAVAHTAFYLVLGGLLQALGEGGGR